MFFGSAFAAWLAWRFPVSASQAANPILLSSYSPLTLLAARMAGRLIADCGTGPWPPVFKDGWGHDGGLKAELSGFEGVPPGERSVRRITSEKPRTSSGDWETSRACADF